MMHFSGFVLIALTGGFLSDKIGKKNTLLIALGGYIICFLFFVFVEIFTIRCLLMFIISGCGGILECIDSAFVAKLNPDRTDYYVNITQVAFSIGDPLF